MLTNSLIQISWIPREPPLVPCAVVAWEEAARRLAAPLMALDEVELRGLEGAAAGEMLLILGPAERLPWADGALYLGRDPEAPSLLLPTALRPHIPASLLERAILARFPALSPPLAVLPAGEQIVSAAAARAIERSRLSAWLEGGLSC